MYSTISAGTLPQLLNSRNLQFIDWPAEVPLPGSDGDNDKRLDGLSKQQLELLCHATQANEEARLDIRSVLDDARLIGMGVERDSGARQKKRREDPESDTDRWNQRLRG